MARYLYKLTCDRHKNKTLDHLADEYITLQIELPRGRSLRFSITPGVDETNDDRFAILFNDGKETEMIEREF
jgi:hypothetical protein